MYCYVFIISDTHRAHMALFYLTGVFYHIAKRITGVQYVSNNLIFFLLTGNLTL